MKRKTMLAMLCILGCQPKVTYMMVPIQTTDGSTIKVLHIEPAESYNGNYPDLNTVGDNDEKYDWPDAEAPCVRQRTAMFGNYIRKECP